MTPLYLYLLSLSGDILTGWMESMLHLRDVVTLETALVYRSQRMRVSRAAQNIINDSINITSSSVGPLVRRNCVFADVKIGMLLKMEEVIMLSEILRFTKTIELDCKTMTKEDAFLAIAKGATALKSLNIKNAIKLTDRGLKAIAQYCKTLKHLNLLGLQATNITRRGMEGMLRGCSMLESISISEWNAQGRYSDFLFGMSKYCKNLRSLQFAHTYVSRSTVAEFAQHCRNLTSVNLSGIRTEEAAVEALIQHRQGLKELHLCTWDHLSPQFFMSIATHFTALTSLGLDNAVPNAALELIGRNCGHRLERLVQRFGPDTCDLRRILLYCRSLTEVDFTCSATFDVEAMELLARQNTALQVVNIDWCERIVSSKPACSKAMRLLADHCPQLRQLITSSETEVQPYAVVYLLERCRHLYNLEGWFMIATDDWVHKLAKYGSKQVKLHLVGYQISNDALIVLTKACTNLESLKIERGRPARANKALICALFQHCRKLRKLYVYCCEPDAAKLFENLVEEKRHRGIVMETWHNLNYESMFVEL